MGIVTPPTAVTATYGDSAPHVRIGGRRHANPMGEAGFNPPTQRGSTGDVRLSLPSRYQGVEQREELSATATTWTPIPFAEHNLPIPAQAHQSLHKCRRHRI
jgi:hypothetical protein